MKSILRKQRTGPPSREARLDAEDTIARATAGLRAGGLRLDWTLLDDDEAADLVRLTRRLRDGRRLDFSQLDGRERSRLQTVVEKAAGCAAGHFQQRREEAVMKAKMESLAARARRPPRKLLAEGAIALDADLGEQLREGYLWASHVAVITVLEFQFQTGVAWAPSARFEGSGDDLVLHFDSHYGLPAGLARGEDDVLAGWQQLMRELEERDWYIVDRSMGKDWAIKRGPRALALGKEQS